MKQYLFFLVSLCSFYGAQAQEDQLIVQEATKINRQLVPATVMDSLHQLFPHMLPIEYYTLPPVAARNAWAVPADSLVPHTDSSEYYLIINKRSDLKLYTLFANDGHLIMTKLREDVSILPDVVMTSIKELRTDYPGYKIRSTACYRNEDRDRRLYYEVIAERGINQQRFFYDPEGTLVKIDIIRRY